MILSSVNDFKLPGKYGYKLAGRESNSSGISINLLFYYGEIPSTQSSFMGSCYLAKR